MRTSVQNVVDSLDTEHKRVVLVADLVFPAAEPAAGVNLLGLEAGQQLLQDAIALEAGRRVAVVEGAVVGRHDLVAGAEEGGVDAALDRVCEKGVAVDGLHG